MLIMLDSIFNQIPAGFVFRCFQDSEDLARFFVVFDEEKVN